MRQKKSLSDHIIEFKFNVMFIFCCLYMINEDGKKQKLYAHLIICLRIFIMKVSDDAVNDEKYSITTNIHIQQLFLILFVYHSFYIQKMILHFIFFGFWIKKLHLNDNIWIDIIKFYISHMYLRNKFHSTNLDIKIF